MGHEDVIKELGRLADDLRENRENWENQTLEDYLDALERWLDDYARQYKLTEPSWGFIVLMLGAGKVYE